MGLWFARATRRAGLVTIFSNDGDEANANIVLDNEEPEIKTMFKSYKGSYKNVSLMMYPEHIREMMASIQFSTSPLRQKQCRRPYCKKRLQTKQIVVMCVRIIRV